MLAYIESVPEKSIKEPWTGRGDINYCKVLFVIDDNFNTDIEDFPELMAKKPVLTWHQGPYWYHPYDRIRVKILKEVIANMKLPLLGRILVSLHIY